MIEVNKDNFDKEVLQSDKRVLVDFNAEWCGPCKMMKPVLEEISTSNNEIKIVSINVDDEDELASKYNVSSIPCLVLIENGEETNRSIGLISRSDLDSFIGGK
ncbi:MAG: thioredoxin [Bacilli bacterium]|nr:thioredoxin [Bacilli bacterium]